MATKAPITDLAKEWLRLDKVRHSLSLLHSFIRSFLNQTKEQNNIQRVRVREFELHANRRLTLFNDVDNVDPTDTTI